MALEEIFSTERRLSISVGAGRDRRHSFVERRWQEELRNPKKARQIQQDEEVRQAEYSAGRPRERMEYLDVVRNGVGREMSERVSPSQERSEQVHRRPQSKGVWQTVSGSDRKSKSDRELIRAKEDGETRWSKTAESDGAVRRRGLRR